ncbi:hypothetical protein NDU88_001949 [Pleurodeles waltl]|uniref:Uncharacterized protein n=1 Tax=Pleurodeles waltl TaxID=8319 RepID=A0AAV7LCY4_PLEWA|nr:hypothetical protein NDU88_001949 [Pleurodeles waltl]
MKEALKWTYPCWLDYKDCLRNWTRARKCRGRARTYQIAPGLLTYRFKAPSRSRRGPAQSYYAISGEEDCCWERGCPGGNTRGD